MVDFNPAEIRGYHGRWILGGPRHKHIRHALAEAALRERLRPHAEASMRPGDRKRTPGLATSGGIGSRGVPRATSADVKKAQEQVAADRVAAAHALATATGGREGGKSQEERDAEKAAKEAEKAKGDKKRARQGRRRRGRGRGGRGGMNLLRGAGVLGRLGLYAHSHKKAKAPAKKKAKAKAKTKKKAPANRKTALKKKTAAKKKVHPAVHKAAKKVAARRHPLAPRPRPPAGARFGAGGAGGAGGPGGGAAGRGTAQKVTPSAQVMANLARYLSTP